MIEPWMMLDNWGNPVPASVLDKQECRVVGLDEFRGLTEGCRYLSELLDKYEEGDTILWHTSPESDWQACMGSEGYVLIRGQYLVHSVVTIMN